MAIFGLSCVFMYFADRTSLFLKVQKQFELWQFSIAILVALVVGLGTMQRSAEDPGFMNRNQTDEVSTVVTHRASAWKADEKPSNLSGKAGCKLQS